MKEYTVIFGRHSPEFGWRQVYGWVSSSFSIIYTLILWDLSMLLCVGVFYVGILAHRCCIKGFSCLRHLRCMKSGPENLTAFLHKLMYSFLSGWFCLADRFDAVMDCVKPVHVAPSIMVAWRFQCNVDVRFEGHAHSVVVSVTGPNEQRFLFLCWKPFDRQFSGSVYHNMFKHNPFFLPKVVPLMDSALT